MNVAIGLDVCVGRARANALKKLGYKIAYVAQPRETDVSWVNKAFANGALFVISADLDVPKIIEREAYPMVWVEYPNDNPAVKDDLVSYLDKTIKNKLRLFKTVTETQEALCSGSYSSPIKSNTSLPIIRSKGSLCWESLRNFLTSFFRSSRTQASTPPSPSPSPSVSNQRRSQSSSRYSTRRSTSR